MALSVDDLLIGAPRLRTKSVNYGPGLDFELHSFTAIAYQQEAQKLAQSSSDGESEDALYGAIDGSGVKDDVVVRLAMRLIEGEDFEATDEQVLAFREKLDPGVIRSIVSDGLAFNRGADNLAEAAKKS